MTRPVAPLLPDLAAALHPRADGVVQLEVAEVFSEVPVHYHEPGILRDTVRCPACAATVQDRYRTGRPV
jgi:hypothetical protein